MPVSVLILLPFESCVQENILQAKLEAMKVSPNAAFFYTNRWAWFSLIGFVGHRLVSDWVRPVFGKGVSAWSFLLGIAPNFLGAALVFPFAGVAAWQFWGQKQGLTSTRPRSWQVFGWISLASQALLIVWEFWQINSRLFFDWNDIVATLVGGGVAAAIFGAALRQNPSNSSC